MKKLYFDDLEEDFINECIHFKAIDIETDRKRKSN